MTSAKDQVRPGQPTWIEASAGTGKTWTLERIVVDRVREGASIESILVVTFTDKATREMRARIRKTLSEFLTSATDPTERNRLSTALLGFDRATIATLHGFCRRTLREHAFLSGRALEEEHEGSRALFGTVFRAWLREELDARGELFGLLSVALDWLEVEGLEALCLRLVGDDTTLEPAFDGPALEQALSQIPSGDALEALIPDLLDAAGNQPGPRMRMGAVLRGLDAARRTPHADGARTEALFSWGSGGAAHREPGQTDAAWLANKLAAHPPLAAPLQRIARSLMTPLPALVSLVVPELRDRLTRAKRRASIVDFDDLVRGMAEALRGPEGAALVASLRERFRHAVVDEFQDTDPVQWEILSRLFSDCRPDRTFVLIGDPKQAIYGFRGADVHTYRRARETVVAQGTSTRLDTSFRATPALLDALHRLILPDDASGADQDTSGDPPFFLRPDTYPEPVRAGNAARDVFVMQGGDRLPLAPITVLGIQGDPPLRLRPARRALARGLAEEVRRLLTADVQVTDGPNTRRLHASDIFVLTRSQSEGLEVADALSRAGVPYAFFKQDGLFQTAEARDLSDVLQALVAPDDVGRRARALATPLFAVTPEDFARIESLPFEHPILERFRALAQVAEREDVAGLLSALLDRSGITRRELYLFASERRLTNYLHLCEVLTAMAIEHHCGAQELSARVAALIDRDEASGSEQDVQRIESERAAVQLLTMHKSKGLEAEVVFVYGGLGSPKHGRAERRIGTRAGSRVGWMLPRSEGTSDAALERSITTEEREESERLLYVAMTRARSLLYLPLFLADTAERSDGGRIKGPYRIVHDRLRALYRRGALSAPLFRLEEIPITSGRKRKAPRRELLAAPHASTWHGTAESVPEARYEALRAQGGTGVVTSYSRMKSERDKAQSREGTDELEAILRYHEEGDALPRTAPTPRDPGGPAFGVAVHRALELLPNEVAEQAKSAEDLAARPETLALFHEMLSESSLDLQALPLLCQLVFAALRSPVGLGEIQLNALALPRRRSAEVPFLLPIPEREHPAIDEAMARSLRVVVKRGYIRGVIDLLFEHEDKIYLVDWKTDRLDDYGPEALRDHVEGSYLIQVRLYALALLRMLDGDATRFGGLSYLFLRGMQPSPDARASGPLFALDPPGTYFVKPTVDELRAWDDELRSSDQPFGYPLGLPRGRS